MDGILKPIFLPIELMKEGVVDLRYTGIFADAPRLDRGVQVFSRIFGSRGQAAGGRNPIQLGLFICKVGSTTSDSA